MPWLAQGGYAAVILSSIISYAEALVKQKVLLSSFSMAITPILLEKMPPLDTSKSS